MAGTVESILGLPEAAARGRSRVAGRQGQGPATGPVGRQTDHPGLWPGAAAAGAHCLAGAARLLSARRDSRMFGERGVRRADAQRDWCVVLLHLLARAAVAAR